MCDSSTAPASAPVPSGMTIDIRPMIEDVSQVMTKHITTILSGVIGEYTIYKETHDTIMGLPCVRKLQERISDLEGGGAVRGRDDAFVHRQPVRRPHAGGVGAVYADRTGSDRAAAEPAVASDPSG